MSKNFQELPYIMTCLVSHMPNQLLHSSKIWVHPALVSVFLLNRPVIILLYCGVTSSQTTREFTLAMSSSFPTEKIRSRLIRKDEDII